MNVVNVYFTPTKIEADETVYVTEDHNLADYAAYPVNPIEADRRVFRTGNRHEAHSVIVMTGNSMNPYVDYAGGTYNLGGRTYGDSPRMDSQRRSASPSTPSDYAGGGFSSFNEVLGTGIRIVAIVLAMIAVLVGLFGGIGAAILPGLGALGLFLFGAFVISPREFVGNGAGNTFAKDAAGFLVMAGYVVGCFIAPIAAIVSLVRGDGGAAVMWVVFGIVMFFAFPKLAEWTER